MIVGGEKEQALPPSIAPGFSAILLVFALCFATILFVFTFRGFTLVASGSLALAIGGSMTGFTLLNAVVLRSLPVHEPDRVFAALRATSNETAGRLWTRSRTALARWC